jgi:Zn-dependent M28 family amino/carboxypeptidase
MNTIEMQQMETRLRQHVAVLAREPRLPGGGSHRAAQEYIAERLQDARFMVEEASDFPAGLPCTNLIARMLPVDPARPVLVVAAHYDTVRDSPGADDNASAVAALLELARWIGPRLVDAPELSARLELAAYDLEEYGFLGSGLHCRSLTRSGVSLRGMISLEMVGYTDPRPGSQQLPPHLRHLYPNVGNFIGICGNAHSLPLLDAVVDAMKLIPGLPVESIAVPGRGESLPAVRLSDHSPFWDHGYQALMITDTSFLRNPHYHQPSDTPDTLDYAFLTKVTAGVCEATWRLLQNGDKVTG